MCCIFKGVRIPHVETYTYCRELGISSSYIIVNTGSLSILTSFSVKPGQLNLLTLVD